MKKAIVIAIVVILSFSAGQVAFAGSLAAWGYNYYGQCNIPSPNSGFIALAAGYGHSLGLKQDGSIVAWGWNDYGQCNIPSPNSGFIAIAAGDVHSLGLKQDGSIVAWRDNSYGQCNIPSPNSGFIAISAGGYHSLGLKQDGSIVAWGWNGYGQCNVPSPNSGFIAIAAGGFHSLGLKQDGSIVAWGANYSGQCNIPSPNTGFVAIAAGSGHSLGLKQDGSIVAWGDNYYGQCNVPSSSSGFIALAAGYGHSLGLKQNGSIVAWGDNYDGQCNIPAGNDFVAIAAGSIHSLAIFSTVASAALSVTPSDGLSSSGVQGGPFSPYSETYTLTNTGGQSLAWTADKTQSWVTLDQTSGTLAGGASTTVTVSINTDANSLATGNYSDTVSFTNTTNGSGDTTRSVALHVIAPGTITLKSDASTLAAALGPGAPPPDVLARLDTPDISGLAFQPVLVGSYGTYTPVPPDAPPDTVVVNIPPGDGENGYFMMFFQLPDVFDNIQLTGVANVDDFGRVFLNGHPLTAPIGSGVSEFGNVAFGTSDPSLFQTGENTILISVANTGSGPSGGAFFVNITSGEEGFKISGKVTDKATGLSLPNIHVTYWNEELEVWRDDYTDANGIYKLTNLPTGTVQIRVEPESYYAWIGTEFNLTQDIDNLDFALPAGAILSGKVIDAETAQPLGVIEGEYSNQRYAVWMNGFTNGDGTFTITNLPPGVAETKVKPNVDTGYAWSLPWPADMIYLNEGEERSNRIVALHKGALVSGYIKDPNGNPMSNFGCRYTGRLCDGWSETDITGRYEIRLPEGIYSIGSDEDDFGALPKEVTITDINQPVNVPDMIVYSEQSGGQISGSVNNPGGYPKTSNFIIIAFETGTVIDPDTWYTIQGPTSETELQQAGPFAITALPQGVNYDVHLLVMSNTPDEIESCALRDSVLNVPVGTTGINLNYTSQGSTVTGKVTNTRGNPVLGATVLLTDSTTANFAGFADTDPNGDYIIYNVPAGTYTATAVHSKYLNTSKTVQVVNGVPANVSTIVMPFAGEKDGADLNGDGLVNMFDFAELANQWLRSGSLEADFTKDNFVDFADLTRIAENWLWQAIWR